MRMRWLFWVVLLSCSLGVVGCKRGSNKNGQGTKPYIVTTTGMIADAAKEVGGQWVKVEGLMGPSVDPHLYKATASDTDKLSRAKLVLYNGLHLEGKMNDLLKKLGRLRPVVAVTDQIPEGTLLKPAGFKGFHDPHIWFDVNKWRIVVKRVAVALSKVDPGHQKEYEANAAAYDKVLAALHVWVKKSIGLIPPKRRILVTSHDAFGYFGKAYGLKVVGLQGVSTVAEAGIKDVERVIKLLVGSELPAVFSETSVSEKMIKAVIQGCKARKHEVRIGGKLFSDAMGAAGTTEGTYVGMVQQNVKNIVKALSGKEPEAFQVPKVAQSTPAKKATTPVRRAPAAR